MYTYICINKHIYIHIPSGRSHPTVCPCLYTYILIDSFIESYACILYIFINSPAPSGTPLYPTATHCNTLQHTATHCNTRQHTATHCNTLQHTVSNCNTLQHTATHTWTQADTWIYTQIWHRFKKEILFIAAVDHSVAACVCA